MINSKDTETIKRLVSSALVTVVLTKGGSITSYYNLDELVKEAFDVVIKEMNQGNI